MGMMVLFPILRCLWLSFTGTDLISPADGGFVGLKNYVDAFSDQRFSNSLIRTLIFTGFSVSIEFILGLSLALLLHQSFKGRGLARACVLIPWILPPAIMAMAWRWIFNDTYGILGDLLNKIGLVEGPIAWLGSPTLAMTSIIFADVWKTAPFIALILLAGLQSIPQDLYEALSIDGAGAFRRFTVITLPLLRPYIAVAILFRTIQAFGVFDLVWVLTGGGPGGSTQVTSLYIYDTVFRYLRLGYGMTLTIMVSAVLFALTFFLVLLRRRSIEF
jgi:multiple sugar transport system permease protein